MSNDLIKNLDKRIGELRQIKIRNSILTECRDELINLREWIAEEGKRNNTCTFNVLGEICEGCKCSRLNK